MPIIVVTPTFIELIFFSDEVAQILNFLQFTKRITGEMIKC